MGLPGRRKRKPRKTKDSLCWDCQKACCGCSWSRSFEPVKGWKAKETKKLYNGEESSGYKVIECPEFVPDVKRGED